LQNNPVIYLTRRAWRYTEGYRKYILLYLLMNKIQATRGADVLTDIYRCAVAYFLIQIGFWLLHGPGRVIERIVAFHVRAVFKAELFQKLTELNLQWQRDHHSGDSIDKINRASASIYQFCGESYGVVYMILRFTGSQILLFWFMPMAALVATTTTLLAITIILAYDRYLYDQYGTINKFENGVAAALHDYVTNIISVIMLRLEERVLVEVRRRIHLSLPVYRSNIVLNELKWWTTNLLIGLMVAVVFSWYGHHMISSGRVVMVGTLFTLLEYLRRIGECFYNCAGIYGNLVREAADLHGVEPIEMAHAAQGAGAPVAPIPAGWREIEVNGLDFTYQDEKLRSHHLADVRLRLVRGRAIAFVGRSGSGKSTLLTLLRGLHVPHAVEVICDGKPIPDKLASVGHCTTLMPQDPEIFADTLLFNITFGIEARQQDIEDAIQMAQFTSVLARLPNGLNTNIAEKGVNLSGGEKQRLALARGIFFSRESDIVLLDEPTSSVDTHNERAIYERLFQLYRDRCMVSSIHKLHLLPLFDYIYVFDDGRVVEEGTFSELVAAGGPLADMWINYQAAENVAAERLSSPSLLVTG
jgi:ATP-binding cassette subfamily B protein